jgi:two-component system, sensor histidine kinase PdtaS
VSDDGIGIPEEVDIREAESMGLQLLHILVENQLDGEVELERDEGTTFTIRFED